MTLWDKSCFADRKMYPLCLPITTVHETFKNMCIWWNKSVSIYWTLSLVPEFIHLYINKLFRTPNRSYCRYCIATIFYRRDIPILYSIIKNVSSFYLDCLFGLQTIVFSGLIALCRSRTPRWKVLWSRIGNGWASVLKTHWSSEIRSSVLNRRYKYWKAELQIFYIEIFTDQTIFLLLDSLQEKSSVEHHPFQNWHHWHSVVQCNPLSPCNAFQGPEMIPDLKLITKPMWDR